MTVEHSVLTGDQLHEPKGVSAATANKLGFAVSSAISWSASQYGESSATASNSSELTFTGLSGYLMIRLTFVDLLRATASTELRMRLSTDNGSTYDSSSLYGTRWMDSAGGASVKTTYWNLSGDNNLLYHNGVLILHNMNSAYNTGMEARFICSTAAGGTGTAEGQYIVGAYDNAAATDAIRIFSSSGNLTSGSVYLEGIRGT